MDKLKFSYEDSILIKKESFLEQKEKLNSYLLHLHKVLSQGGYNESEAFLNLPDDETLHKEIKETTEKLVSPKLKYVFVIGIGGSCLGTMAIYEALFGKSGIHAKNKPKLIFLDTNNSTFILNVLDLIKKEISSTEEFVLNVVCKSGMTTETMVNFKIVYNALLSRFENNSFLLSERVVMTISEGTELWKISKEQNFKIFTIPKQIGGRYSVFTPVGLFPLTLLGVDIDELMKGVKDANNQFITKEDKPNPCVFSAISLYLHILAGKNIVNNFIFNADLESFGKWYAQLISESIGKEFDRDGKEVRSGITPITSIGSYDLHSTYQLFIGGPRDKITYFTHSLNDFGITLSKESILENIIPNALGKDVNEIMRAILEGVKITYKKNDLPYFDIELKEVSPFSMGALMQFKMIETIFLAELLNLNAFDQPNVESYKLETKKILESK